MNETVWNTTNSAMSMNSASGMISILIVLGIALVFVGVVGFALSNLERYKRIWAILEKIGTSAVCFAYGLCVVVPIVLLYFIITWVITISEEYHLDPIWIVYIILGYGGISVIGWFVRKAVERLKTLQKEVQGDTE